ncbi:MAG: imidazolonepropionase-like amidohydrolase [Pseudohongiellaceae bacterium]|jgi:imidazolonepropionase-like amidohydrolase
MKYCFQVLISILMCTQAHAQNMTIINAHIIDGNGTNIENGTIVIEDGLIVSVSDSTTFITGENVIDARNRTILPGYIDGHRHIIGRNIERWFDEESEIRMQEFLEAGFTTLMSGGGPVPGIIELKRRIEAREIIGPRIITSGRVDPQNFVTAESARAEVNKMAEAGVEIIKVRMNVPEEKALVTEIVKEAEKHGLDVMVHASSSPATMVAAVETGAGKLVHTPHGGYINDEQAKMVAEAGIENLTTAGFAVPTFGAFNDDNIPTFRDGNPWPEGILEGGYAAAGEKVVNARTLWDNGVVLGFGTDTGYNPRDGLKHELRTLNLMFSERDIIKLMGPNTAAFLEMEDKLGSISEGQIADLVLVDGDPLDIIFNLLNVSVVIKGGEIVVDKR